MSVTHETDVVGLGQSRVLEQFKERPRFLAWLASYLQECQQIEDMFYSLLLIALDNPDTQGYLLDMIGRIVDQARLGLGDDEYRVFLRARILANRSAGRLPDLLGVLAALVPNEVIGCRVWWKSMEFWFPEFVDLDPIILSQQFLGEAKAGGDRVTLTIPQTDNAHTFILDDERNLTNLTTQNPGDGRDVNDGALLSSSYDAG